MSTPLLHLLAACTRESRATHVTELFVVCLDSTQGQRTQEKLNLDLGEAGAG